MFPDVLICILSIMLGMTIMWIIFLLKEINSRNKEIGIVEKHKEDTVRPIIEQEPIVDIPKNNDNTSVEKILTTQKNHSYKIIIGVIFAIGLVVGILLGYSTMKELNDDIHTRQQKSHIGYIIEDSQNNNIISKGGDFVEEKCCS